MINKAEILYHELDPNIVNLCKAINACDGLVTTRSCVGHQDPEPCQNPAGTWAVYFDVEHSQEGWFAMEFLTWAVTHYSPVQARIETGALPPYVNNPGQCLYFVLEGKGAPDQLAEWIGRQREGSYFSLAMLELEVDVVNEEAAQYGDWRPPVGLHLVRLVNNVAARDFDLYWSEDVADLADYLNELEPSIIPLDPGNPLPATASWEVLAQQ